MLVPRRAILHLMQIDALITHGARTTKEFRRNLDNIAEDHRGMDVFAETER